MKKLLILALVALVAGGAFADTAPAFSGSFELFTTMDFEDEVYKIGATNDAVVNLNGVVSDYASVGAELSVDEKDLEDDQNLNISLNSFTLTTDITGALGVAGPVAVSLEWGLVTHEAAEYNGVAGYKDVEPTSETSSYWGFNAIFTIVEKVKLIALIPPSTYTDYTIWLGEPGGDNDGNLGPYDAVVSLEVQFLQLIEGLDANFWYTDDPNHLDGGAPDPISELGFTAGYVMAPVSVGALFKYDMELEAAGAGISGQYDLGAFTAGLAFGVSDFSEFAAEAFIGVNGTFHAVPDVLDIFAAVRIPFEDIGDNFAMDAGIQFFLAGVTYTAGYDYNGSGFQSPDGQGMFFKVQADF